MKPDTKNRLDRLLFMQRLKYGLIIGGVVIALLGVVGFGLYEEDQHADKVIGNHLVMGTVVTAKRGPSRNSGYYLTVRLDNGGSIKTISQVARVPYEGERISLREIDHKSGRKVYLVNQLKE